MNHDRFDDLTRALASSASRRQALKLLGGGLLAALVPGSVFAKGGSNSACSNFCAQVFGANTKAAGQCTSDATKGKGLCYECGPKSDGSQRLCGTTCIGPTQPCNGSCPSGSKLCDGSCIPNDQCCGGCIDDPCNRGTCQNGTCVRTPTICSHGQFCVDGECRSPCPAYPGCTDACPCPSGQTCQNGTCVATCPEGKVQLANGSCATPCTTPGASCGSCGSGVCTIDQSGAIYCLNASIPGNGTCATDSDCPQGTFCVAGTSGLCASLC